MSVQPESSIPEALRNVSDGIELLSQPSIKNIQNGILTVAQQGQADLIGYLKRMVKEIDLPLLRNLSLDMVNLLGSFYASEEVLCCLVKNLIMLVYGTNALEGLKKKMEEIKRRRLEANLDPYAMTTEELGIAGTIDQIVFIIDAIIIILEFQVQDIVFPLLDISELLLNAIIGGVIIAIQEIVYGLRDASIAWLLEQIDKSTGTNGEWMKCLPFLNLVNILKRYIKDYDLLDWLFSLINGQIGKISAKWRMKIKADNIKNIKALEWLKFIRTLLLRIKSATLSWEFCVDLTTSMESPPEVQSASEARKNSINFLRKVAADGGYLNPNFNRNSIIADDNTILINDTGRNLNNLDSDSKNTRIRFNEIKAPSNSDVNAFLKNTLGIPGDLVDQITGFTSQQDHVQGTMSSDPTKTNNDCGFILNNNDLQSAILSALRTNGIL